MSPTERTRDRWLHLWTRVDNWAYDHIPPVAWPVFWPATVAMFLVWVVLALLSTDAFAPRIYRK